MKFDITEIVSQPLSSLTCDFLICLNCRIVDRDQGRIRVGHRCPECGHPGEGGRLYFSINVRILIDLIQEAFHGNAHRLNKQLNANNISVVIFFCVLREALLENLIMELFVIHQIPQGVRERLLADNRLHSQKQNKLFKSLTGVTWKEAISAVDEHAQLDYSQLDEFVKQAVDHRNRFIHRGSQWSIDRSLSQSCLENAWGLVNLYVSLHNTYVHPHYSKD
jgi:hypothetical protein